MSGTAHDSKPILVLGGSGKTGSRVVERLTALGLPTRVGSRSAVPPFDWDVDADDIADVAVAALTDDRHVGEVYELTSPRLLTFADAVAEIAKATGRDISYVPVTVEDYAAGAADHGVPVDFVAFPTYLFSDVLGRNAYLTDGVQRALGRQPRDFGDYVCDTAASGVWNGATPG